MSPVEELYLKDVLDLPEEVHAGQFKVELSGGFDATAVLVDQYVVTDQLKEAFDAALSQVRIALTGNTSLAAYLHGSFGSGKSHFMTVLHAVLEGHQAVLGKPRLRELYAENSEWLSGRRFIMVPYHLVGATDLGSKLLGGYVTAVRELGLPVPAVYRSDALLADARRQREFLSDDAAFAKWLGSSAIPEPDPDDVMPIGGAVGWTTATLDAAFAAPHGSTERDALVSALLTGPLSSYARGQAGVRDAFLPLDEGLGVISRHAHQHGYNGLVLFLDELILWLQAHMSNQEMVNDEVSKLVKLIEAEDSVRPVPIISFISRQRDLSKLVGEDVMGAEVRNLERQVEYLAGRFQVISLEDRNLPAIIRERVLRPREGMRQQLADAFADVSSEDQEVRDVLLDSGGATEATWNDFRDVYPLSPALLNVLVALSGALQRERTGLKLLSEMLRQRGSTLKLGQIIPVGDLWDVLSGGIGEAFSDRLKHEAAAATRFHARVKANLLEEYGSADDARYQADDRLVKTLILSTLAPDVNALKRLTGARLAALNLGSIKSRVSEPASIVNARLKRLITSGFGEIRADGDHDPVFSLNLTDLDIEPLLERVTGEDHAGTRRLWIKKHLWEALDVKDTGAFVSEREIVWRGSRRTAEFIFDNVRDAKMTVDQFKPSVPGHVRFVLDYPFDTDKYPSDDYQRVEELRRDGLEADTLVWLPHHLSAQRGKQLGRLLRISFLLQNGKLREYAGDKSSEEQARIAQYLESQKDTLTNELKTVLQYLYGIVGRTGESDSNIGAEVPENRHVSSLNPELRDPRLHGGAGFKFNAEQLADAMFAAMYPKHPNFDTAGARKAVTPGDLKTVLKWIALAMDDGERRVVVDRDKLGLMRRIVHPLDLGEVHDGPLNVGTEWLRRIDQRAAQSGKDTRDLQVEDIRTWIADLGWTGLDRNVSNLVISVYALLADRAWVFQGVPSAAPEVDRIGPGWVLRDQDKPSPEEYAAARARLQAVFGKDVPPLPFSRNVDKLAALLREQIAEFDQDVLNVRNLLREHADTLGLAPDAARLAAADDAASFLARLAQKENATELVRELAAVTYRTQDKELGNAVKSAPQVAAALRRTGWQTLGSLPSLVRREDGVGRSALAVTTALSEAANSPDYLRPLADALRTAEAKTSELVQRVLAESVVAPPKPDPVVPKVFKPEIPSVPEQGGASGTRPTASQTSLTENGDPPVSGAGRRRTVRAASVEGDLQLVSKEMRDYLNAHPGAEVELVWRPVQGVEPPR
ncbi:hypothetical protein EDD29_0530 [Actinocorallia herbida]|uniref:Phage resistance protein n=1 Tax=Actinocorallia herbida TaxID=58109 RepID=A0A3N1CP05_9ACTN|nr:PglY protein [Actinocorallia herbida]ROO83041.1 hypothetical protein EDD29_0530 [Actinocorallia herbida]